MAIKIKGLIQPSATFSFTVDQASTGQRVDVFLSKQFDSYSRSFFQRLIENNYITINTRITHKQGSQLKTNDVITVNFPEDKPFDSQIFTPSELNVTCIHQDEHFLIIAKPAGLTTHKPNQWYPQPTLVDWLQQAFNNIAAVGYIDRPGIVHRLDKDTSGLMLIARTNHGHTLLTGMFKERAITKTYLALVKGHPLAQGTINLPIKRHPTIRTKMYVPPQGDDLTARDAVTYYKVLHYFKDCSLVEVKPVTGRTHQIRVHFSALSHPLLGDLTYGTASPFIERHALHAYKLRFEHQGTQYNFTHNPPDDFKQALIRAHVVTQEALPEVVQTLLE